MASLLDKLTYEPVELSFGTSGLRGLVTDMTDLECYINTIAFMDFIVESGGHKMGDPVYVGGDLRDSTPRITAAVCRAISDHGCVPVYCGLLPTPALAYYAQEHAGPCVMVTGSHIPAVRNGIKFYKPAGEILKSDEASIKDCVAKRRRDLYASDDEAFTADGALSQPYDLPAINTKATELYMQRYLAFGDQALAGSHIVVYQHSAVGRDLLVDLLEKLGAKVTPVGRSDTFIPIDTENVTPDNKTLFAQFAADYPDAFAIVSTDGDSDRPFVIDEKGEFYRGDILGCILSEELAADFVAVPISSNGAVDKYCEQKGIALQHTKIGSPYVIEAMQAATGNTLVGWEVNGGFLLGSDVTYQNVHLAKLPTRDAVLPILGALFAARHQNKKVSELFAELPQRFTGAGLIDVDQQAADGFRRLSTDQSAAEALVSSEFADSPLGQPSRIDTTDGIRIYFETGDIIHVRPSGNAPQLRIYTNCDSQAQADDLAIKATAPGGLLEQFIKSIG
jgi:phosphomannomutase